MALAPATAWEVRTTGSANNGSGFNNRIPGTSVDYSQQNASQLSKADLACAAGSVTVTSVTNGFTNAMVGNVMRIRSGTNFTPGFYEIVQFNGVGSVDLDRVPVTANGSIGVAEVGGAQINLDLIDTVVVAGNTIWIKANTYAAHPAVTLTGAYTFYLPLSVIGYNAARGDNPTGANRPIIQMGTNAVQLGNASNPMIKIRNIAFEGSGTYNLQRSASLALLLENCKITNLKSTAGATTLIYWANNLTLIDCELSGTAGSTSVGINIGSSGANCVINSYIYNLTTGIDISSNLVAHVLFNIFAKCNDAIVTGNNGLICINNVFAEIYNDAINITGTDYTPLLMNNSFSDVVGDAIESVRGYLKNSNFFGCGIKINGLYFPERLADNNIYVNPQFVTPGSNFALQRTSGLIDRAFSNRLGV